MIEAIKAGRIEIDPGIAESLDSINLKNPDFTIVKTTLTSCWGPNERSDGGFEIRWTTRSAGSGLATFYLKDGDLHCDNEGMGPDFLNSMFGDLVARTRLDG